MSSGLAATQQAFLAALWTPSAADGLQALRGVVQPLRPGADAQLTRAFAAYRAHGIELARRALGAAYPVLRQMLDEDNFRPLARTYWLAHPPQTGDMACWGGGLADFIARTPQLSEEPCLPDVARVEWLLHRLAFAADGVQDPASLALLAAAGADDVSLVLSPDAACIASPWPVVSLVQAHLAGEPAFEAAAAKLAARTAETALVWRDGLRPRVREALPGEPDFVAALQRGASLAAALAVAPQLDFQAWLGPAYHGGLVLGAQKHTITRSSP